jgi:hypothetical protein
MADTPKPESEARKKKNEVRQMRKDILPRPKPAQDDFGFDESALRQAWLNVAKKESKS